MATSLEGADVTDERIKEIRKITDYWALANGLTKKVMDQEEDSGCKVNVFPYTLFPTVVPRSTLQHAKATMVHFNSLMHQVALDDDFMETSLAKVMEVDDFIARLWDIYTQVRNKGLGQSIVLGIFRNDFMMKVKDGFQRDADRIPGHAIDIKQIEFNSISSTASWYSERVGDLHKLSRSLAGKSSSPGQCVENSPIAAISKCMVKAWELYKNPKAVILMIVTPRDYDIIDRFGLELGVYQCNPKIRFVRKTLMEIGTNGKLDDNNNLIIDGEEVALVYFRDGYTSENYTSEKQWEARLLIEMSRAIKSPTIPHQLIGSKKIQQVLAEPGCLERFIDDPDVVRMLRDTFAGQYSIDLGPDGDKAVQMALADPDKYILKPQREGGGHNFTGKELTEVLEKHKDTKERSAYILMETIFPWEQKNYLVKDGMEMKMSRVISEIGIFGVYLESGDTDHVVNIECGHMLRTKFADNPEAEGGCTDSAVFPSYD